MTSVVNRDRLDLFNLANEYLEACVSALATTDAGAPERFYVSPGAVVWDCEQLTVHVGGPQTANTLPVAVALDPGHRSTVAGQVNMVQLTATVLRCIPVFDEGANPPTPQEYDTASVGTLSDLWAIWNYVASAHRQDALFTPKERELVQDNAIALRPEGGLAGWEIPIFVQLDGYRAFVPA